jgi:hypothetical protein
MGTPLPKDYKEFIGRYGTGFFAELFYVFNPFASRPDQNLLDQLKELGQYYRQQHEEDKEDYPYEVYPRKPGQTPLELAKSRNRTRAIAALKAAVNAAKTK